MPALQGKDHHLAIASERTVKTIEVMLRRYPGITRREIAARIGLGEIAVGKHVKTIRARVWGG